MVSTDSEKYLVVIGGPTGIGKTRMSINLAQHYESEILSADSRQFYKQLTIGTGKPDSSELNRVKHHFIDTLNVWDDYSVGDFERDGISVLQDLFTRHNVLFLVGGSGLYIRALCEGLDVFPAVKPEVVEALKDLFREQGIGVLQNELEEKDPGYYEMVDVNNAQRMIRALAIMRVGQRPFSDYLAKSKKLRPFKCIYVALSMDRSKLYTRINSRVDQMMSDGLESEVLSVAMYKKYNALQTVGYKEMFEYMDNRITRDEAIEKMKRNSRRYAKRQMTWFRNQGDWTHFEAGDEKGIIRFIESQKDDLEN